MRTKATLAALSAAALVAACGGGGGGGGDDPMPATSEVPPSASASVDGFVDYLRKLVASSADLLEPVGTAAVTGPTDETSEPKKVD